MKTSSPPYSCFALVSALALPNCSQPASAAEASPIPVKVEAVASADGVGPNRYSGSLEPAVRVDLAFRVGGYVESLGEVSTESGTRSLDKGDFVKKGQLLARVRAADYAEKARSANAQLLQARAEETLAEQELVRARRLFDGGAIAKAELDSSVARAASAKAQVQGALAQSGEAGLSLGDTSLRAPMDGVVLSRPVEVGALVSPGQPAITIADVRSLKAVFGAPQVLVEKLAVGSPVSVFVGAESEAKQPEKLLEARVTRIAPAADTNGRVFSIEAALPNPDGELRAGSVVSVRVLDQTRAEKSLLVPLRAVIRSPRDTNGFSVFVLEGDGDRAKARLRDVTLGEVVGNGVTVTRGIQPRDRVVTIGATLLRDGSDAVVIR